MQGLCSAARVPLCLLLAIVGFASPVPAQVVDIIPPTVTAEATTAPNANGWYRANVRVRFTCADTGGSKLAFCPPAVVVATEGENQVISGTARDKAGNTATASVTLNVDKTAPVVTASRSPEAPASGWSITPVTVTFDATDALSGLAPGTLTAPITLATDRTNGSATGRATDLAGNVGTFKQTGINIDQKPPRVTVVLTPPVTKGGFRTGTVTAHFTCSDARSGIAVCPPDQVFDQDGRAQTVTGSTTDHAGHSTTVSKVFNLDATPPVIHITAPEGNVVPEGTTSLTITGTVTDATAGVASLFLNGRKLRVRPDTTFTSGPLVIANGPNAFELIATDRAGNVRQHAMNITVPVAPVCTNLVQDPQFESGVSGFMAQDDSSLIALTTESPIEGASSLRLATAGYGNNLWWVHDFSGGRASHFKVSAQLRSDLASESDLQFCAMVYYQDGTTALNCTAVSGAVGDKGVVTTELDLDSSQPLETVRIRMYQEGGSPLSFTMDSALACLEVVAPPTDGGGGDDGGGGGDDGGGGGGGPTCTPPAPGTSAYPGYGYTLPTVRPFISLSDYTGASATSTPYLRLIAAANDALDGNAPYAYSATQSIIAYRLTGNPLYLADAIARVDQFVTEFEDSIAAGGVPGIAGDSYLEVGWYLENLSLTYDQVLALEDPPTVQLTAQLQRWAAIADQALFNVWHPNDATWGGVSHPWTGWSICDPGNNYHYSFLRATMLWEWATQNTTWLDFLQTQKFGSLIDYFVALPGGGSREGTGYGTAQKNLFENYIIWRASTTEDLASLSNHTRETIDYWVHATVPTRDRFAPIGDQSRSSIPELYDYHENLVHAAVVLTPTDAPEAGRGTWWLQNNSVNGVANSFNLMGDLLPYPAAPLAPTELVYHASGAGALFARSSWATDAAWLSFIAGKYDQSHAHHDQGSFTFFKGDWLAVTNNIWSHSGLHLEVEAHNVIRFERADGSAIEQNPSETVQSSMSYSTGPGVITVSADLTNAYSASHSLVQAWTRTVELSGEILRVTDACTVTAGVQPVFQVQVPVEPVLQPDGSIVAGGLRILPLQPVTASWTAMTEPEFSGGYRIDLRTATGCAFSVELQPQ